MSLSKLPRTIVAAAIRVYQKTFSPDHGILHIFFPHGYCRFTPTCSEYGRQAVLHYGVIRGSWKALRRILRCNPFNEGGHDPLT